MKNPTLSNIIISFEFEYRVAELCKVMSVTRVELTQASAIVGGVSDSRNVFLLMIYFLLMIWTLARPFPPLKTKDQSTVAHSSRHGYGICSHWLEL